MGRGVGLVWTPSSKKGQGDGHPIRKIIKNVALNSKAHDLSGLVFRKEDVFSSKDGGQRNSTKHFDSIAVNRNIPIPPDVKDLIVVDDVWTTGSTFKGVSQRLNQDLKEKMNIFNFAFSRTDSIAQPDEKIFPDLGSFPTGRNPRKIIFVCKGNQHRSPLAEGIFLKFIQKHSKNKDFYVESAGVGTIYSSIYQPNQPPAKEIMQIAKNNKIDLHSSGRQFNFDFDFSYFDHIVVMDKQNLSVLEKKAEGFVAEKVKFLSDYSSEIEIKKGKSIKDPYGCSSDVHLQVYKTIHDSVKNFFDSMNYLIP